MTREQAEQIARKHADLRSSEPRGEDALTLTHAINAILEAAAIEREACAQVCESFGGNGSGYIDDDWVAMCAKTIRAR